MKRPGCSNKPTSRGGLQIARRLGIGAIALPGYTTVVQLPAVAAPDPEGAVQVSAAAEVICARDRGALKGSEVCGPSLIVDPVDRAVIANQGDSNGTLKTSGVVFAGTLPDEVNVANIPTKWSGARGTQPIGPGLAPVAQAGLDREAEHTRRRLRRRA